MRDQLLWALEVESTQLNCCLFTLSSHRQFTLTITVMSEESEVEKEPSNSIVFVEASLLASVATANIVHKGKHT